MIASSRFNRRTPCYRCVLCCLIFSILLSAIFLFVGLLGVFRTTRLISVCIFVGTLVAIFILGILVYKSERKMKREEQEGDLEEGTTTTTISQISGVPRKFSYKDLQSATSNFHRDNKLGRGGFGSVFQGKLRNGTKVAVKRLDSNVHQGKKEFSAEVKTIGIIHHVNLVRLLGYCTENSHKLLVYEHMCNGSLDKWIFRHNQLQFTLAWETRRKIILGIAKGLSYLHEDCRKTIIHMDIKPQNILLDHDFTAKVSDFGLARFLDLAHNVYTMKGTPGYMAPEWWSDAQKTEKLDVYSFGVLVLEIMCGRKNMSVSNGENEYLLHLVRRKAEENQLFDVVDRQSEDLQTHGEEAVKMVKIGIWCLQSDSARRPAMSTVVKVLEGFVVMESISDYSFLSFNPSEQRNPSPRRVEPAASVELSAVLLSGPR